MSYFQKTIVKEQNDTVEKPMSLLLAIYMNMEKSLNVFWPYFHPLQNKKDGVIDLKDNSSKGRWNPTTAFGKQATVLV